MTALVRLVEDIRTAKGPDFQVPNFDPLDGGAEASVLFLLEAPGPQAVTSGFVSRNNPDLTAKNFFMLNAEAGIDRRRTVIWNAVPWYIGARTGTSTRSKIRPAERTDVRQADSFLGELLNVLRHLEYVCYVGKQALNASPIVDAARRGLTAIEIPHPSQTSINCNPGTRSRILSALQDLSARLGRP